MRPPGEIRPIESGDVGNLVGFSLSIGDHFELFPDDSMHGGFGNGTELLANAPHRSLGLVRL